MTKISSNKTIFSTNENIEIVWSSAKGTQSYWVTVWKGADQIYSQDVGVVNSFTLPSLSTGDYTIIVVPANFNGSNTNSTLCNITVTDSVPSPVTELKSDKSLYSTEEEIKLFWNSTFVAQKYWLTVWNGPDEIYRQDVGQDNSYALAALPVGDYSIIVVPENYLGIGQNNAVYSFSVKNTSIDDGFFVDLTYDNENNILISTNCENINATLIYAIYSKEGKPIVNVNENLSHLLTNF